MGVIIEALSASSVKLSSILPFYGQHYAQPSRAKIPGETEIQYPFSGGKRGENGVSGVAFGRK